VSSRSRKTRAFTISFPDALAKQAEEVAQQESRNVSELFREAFRTYCLERIKRERAAVAARTGLPHIENDEESSVDEIGSKLSPGRKRKV